MYSLVRGEKNNELDYNDREAWEFPLLSVFIPDARLQSGQVERRRWGFSTSEILRTPELGSSFSVSLRHLIVYPVMTDGIALDISLFFFLAVTLDNCPRWMPQVRAAVTLLHGHTRKHTDLRRWVTSVPMEPRGRVRCGRDRGQIIWSERLVYT